MKRFYKGASLGFTTTTALLAAFILSATFVSCGRTHGQSSAVGSGRSVAEAALARRKLAPTAVGAPLAAPGEGMASTAPTIPLSDLLKEIDAYPAPKGVSSQTWTTLVTELKRLLIARASGSKTISIAPTGTMNAVTDLAAIVNPAGTQATLAWTEVLPGDYDNNGAVDIADILPVALYYGQRTDSGPDDAHRLVNGDFNPEINIWDLGAIAANYAAHIQGYQVLRRHFNSTTSQWETTFRPNPNLTNTDWSADRPSPPPVSTRPAYNYVDDISGLTDTNYFRYEVIAFGDGAAGAESNEATMPPVIFTISGTVTSGGSGVSGVALRLSGRHYTATTDADGTFAITGSLRGPYSLMPYKEGFVFAPAFRSVTVGAADVSGQDFVASADTGLSASAWPKFRGNNQNTGLSPYVGAQTNTLKWTYYGGAPFCSSPVIGADGTVYILSFTNGYEVCNGYGLNPSDGTLDWRGMTGANVRAAAAIGADGTLYVGSFDCKVYALNPVDGDTKWTMQTGDWVLSSPAIGADGTVYVGSDDRNLYAVNPLDGSVRWVLHTAGEVEGCPAIGSDGTIYIGNYDGKLYAVNPGDGSVMWMLSPGGAIKSSPAIGADGTVYFVGGLPPSNVYAASPADGTVKWEYAASWFVDGSPAIGPDGTVYVGTGDNKVYALNPVDGNVEWTYATGGQIESTPAIGADGIVYIGSDDHKVYALNGSDGSLRWQYATGGAVMSSPAIGADGTVYIGSADGKVYAFGP